jgi:uncharacterized protein
MWVPGGSDGRGFAGIFSGSWAAREVNLQEPPGVGAQQNRMTETAKIHSIYRYPVKGLSPEPLPRAYLGVGATVPGDRLYAVENGPSDFDPAAPRYQPKQRYLMLMRNERLAALRSRLDEASHTLVIESEAREMARGDLHTAAGRAAIEEFFTGFCAPDLRGPPKLLHAPGFSFSDVARKVVSIINLDSIPVLEIALRASVDPLRFRANLYVSGWPAWHEFDLIGRQIAIGDNARVKIVKRVVRCAATEVNPATGARDLPIPQTLMRMFGHRDFGVYGEVLTAGDVAVADAVRVSTWEIDGSADAVIARGHR